MSYFYSKNLKDILLNNLYDLCWIKITNNKKHNNVHNNNVQNLLKKNLKKYSNYSISIKELNKLIIDNNIWFLLYEKIKKNLAPDKLNINNLSKLIKIPNNSNEIIKELWSLSKDYIINQIKYISYEEFIEQFYKTVDFMFIKLKKIKFEDNEKIFIPIMRFNKSNTWLFFLALQYAENNNTDIYNILRERVIFINYRNITDNILIRNSIYKKSYIMIFDDAIYSGEQFESLLLRIPLCLNNIEVLICIPYLSKDALNRFNKLLPNTFLKSIIINGIINENITIKEFLTKHNILLNQDKSYYNLNNCFKQMTIFEHKTADSLSLNTWLSKKYMRFNKGIINIYQISETYKPNNIEINNLYLSKYKNITSKNFIKLLNYLSKNIKNKNLKLIKSINYNSNNNFLIIPPVLPDKILNKTTGHYTNLLKLENTKTKTTNINIPFANIYY
jgi:hypothetical protein